MRLTRLLACLVCACVVAQVRAQPALEPASAPAAPAQAALAPAQAGATAVTAVPAPVRSLEELLERVRAGGAQRAEAERQRKAEFSARKSERQALLEAARAELELARKRALELEQQWEKNHHLLGERQSALRARLGTLAEVFAELGSAGPPLRDALRASPTAVQFGPAREDALDALLATAASGERLPAIADLDALWFELSRELAESGRVRRFDAEVTAADGARARGAVVRAGTFNLLGTDGAYLVYDAGSRQLQQLARQPGGALRDDARAVYAAPAGAGAQVLGIDPGGVRDPHALRAAAAAPTAGEQLRGAGALAWIAVLLGLSGAGFALYRMHCVQRQLDGRAGADDPRTRIDAVARDNAALDAISLELVLDEAVLREVPALGLGLRPLRAIGTLAPLLGALGTVVALSGADPAVFGEGASLHAALLGQSLLSAVLGLCAGIPVLVLQALLSMRVERAAEQLDQHAAQLVTARVGGRLG